MTKAIRQAQKRRGKVVKARLETINKKIVALIGQLDTEGQMSNDRENCLGCLTSAKLQIEEAIEFYTTFI